MKLIGLLPWYLEKPAWLAAAVTSLAKCCDHIVAVDGAYEMFPRSQERPSSGTHQSEQILEAAYAAGCAVTVHVPREPFAGNEVGKRTFMLRLAQAIAEPGVDWLLSIDADMIVTHAASELKDELAALPAGCDAATYYLWWADDRHTTQIGQGMPIDHDVRPGGTPCKSLFRAWHNMRVEHIHNCYLAENDDGETVYYWAHPAYERPCDEADCTDLLRVEHRHSTRSRARMELAHGYYTRRDSELVEVMPNERGARA